MKLLHICLIITSIFLQSSNCTLKDDRRFDLWKKQFGKNYKSSLYEDKAKAKFYQNLQKIDEHNQRFENGLETYRRGTWDRSDMSYEEKKSTLTSGTSINNTLIFESANTSHNSNLLAEPSSNPPRAYLKTKQSPSKPNLRQSGAPTSLDWTALGRVHSVVDQGKCGGCYAFATVGTLEGVALKNNVQNRFSVQQIIDCNKSTFGCNGGDPAASLKYAVSSGLASSSDYPFKMKKGKCENFQKTKAFSKSYTTVLNGNEQKLMETVAKYGPVTVAVSVPDSFMNYQTGVYSNQKCSKHPEHAILLTGYGTDPKFGNYWIAKNSWGTSWGEAGYIRMARGKKGQNNLCGIANAVWYAT